MPAMGDLFAPAFQRGNAASEQAVSDWQNRVFNVTPSNIEQTRMPVSFNTGNPGGMLDPEALRVLAQGGPYDFNARRNAIAAAAAKPAAQTPAPTVQQPAAPTYPDNPYGSASPIYSTNSDGYQQAVYTPSPNAYYQTNSDGYQQLIDPWRQMQGPVFQPTS